MVFWRMHFVDNVNIHLQLFREALSKKAHATIPKGTLGYDQQGTVPDTVAVELTFVAFF